MLAVGAGGCCLDIIFLSSFIFSFSLSLEGTSILIELPSQRGDKPKTTNTKSRQGK